MKTPEQIFDKAIQAKGLDVVSVKDADLYEAGLDAIRQALSIANAVVSEAELCGKFKPYFGIGKIGWEVTHCANCGKKHKHNEPQR